MRIRFLVAVFVLIVLVGCGESEVTSSPPPAQPTVTISTNRVTVATVQPTSISLELAGGITTNDSRCNVSQQGYNCALGTVSGSTSVVFSGGLTSACVRFDGGFRCGVTVD